MQVLPLDDNNLYLFNEGTHHFAYRLLGAHLVEQDGQHGVRFAVWAPAARAVSVIGSFNSWNGDKNPLTPVGNSGVWAGFVPAIGPGELYKYRIVTPSGAAVLKADPYAFQAELRPNTASIVCDLSGYHWQDSDWRAQQVARPLYDRPLLIYEVHLGSWRRKAGGKWLNYRELAHELADYAAGMGYTHIELLPLAEHPFDGSWGYQATGYYAVTSRYGTPHDFMYFVDYCHQKGLGVIIDWAPSHFCMDEHGLAAFDGTRLYEGDWWRRENRQWGTANFDLGRPQVVSYLIANAVFWFDVYHVDGLRVDAVANMLYLDYGRGHGEWQPNRYGDNCYLEGVAFLKKLNETIFHYFPYGLMIAEESTAWPLVSRPTYLGGLGFNFKWNMGWMNDVLKYMQLDPIFRKYHHYLLTFSLMYAFAENFILPFSHDEAVHGKKSLLDKMPGDYWQKFANLRLLYAYWLAHPGKKLLFMGSEFGQFSEWKYNDSLDWHLLGYDMHRKLHAFVSRLNWFYRQHRALWECDHVMQGFKWIDCCDSEQSVLVFLRQDQHGDFIIIACNFTPVVRCNYRIGAPAPGIYQEIFNSDEEVFGGSGQTNPPLTAEALPWHGEPYSLTVTLPPLAAIFLKPVPA
ncbi:1,4-alpha-glucan branching protein GlgB [Thermosinus carboxydivorans]|nr:1,4-alpha-glucan branching protein GlgB [Thermosinus carboxydivorans]